MKKIAVIHQPDFIPYLGFFHRFLSADIYIVLDHVQFSKNSRDCWTHRDKIKTQNGAKWLTISTKKAPLSTPINKVELSKEVNWREENLNLLKVNYMHTPYYKEIMPKIEGIYSTPFKFMYEFNLKFIDLMIEFFDIQISQTLSSTLDPSGRKNELLADLLQKSSATHYLSGVGAKDYFDQGPFDKVNIEVIWQEFQHPVYIQQFGDFIPYLSSLDLLFNSGVEKSRRILREI